MNFDLLKGKKGVVMGVANSRSIATFIAKSLHVNGASLAFSHLPDEKGRMLKRVEQAVGELDPAVIAACDVNSDKDLDDFFAKIKTLYGTIDFLVHSIAYAPLEDIRCPTLEVSRAGFLNAMESSVYSFIATAKRASALMSAGGSILTLSYFGGEKVVSGYNLMGVAKSALESSVRYLAFDLGKRDIRVNAISAGPVKTLAASAVSNFSRMLTESTKISPISRCISGDELGKSATYLLSDLSSGTTGEVLHVDCGYNIMGSIPQ